MSIPNYSGKLKTYAREHRQYSTLAEVVLWNEGLKQRKLGYQFNRQKPLENYIVDFFCKPLNLIIELDGLSHVDGATDDNKQANDLVRQKVLEQKGYNIIRFKDEEIVSSLENSLTIIKDWIYEYENKNRNVIKFKSRKKCFTEFTSPLPPSKGEKEV